MPPRAASRRARRRRGRSRPRIPLFAPLADGFALGELERAALGRSALADVVADADLARPAEAARDDDGRLVLANGDADRRPADLHRERQAVELVGQRRREEQDAVADLRAGVGALDE